MTRVARRSRSVLARPSLIDVGSPSFEVIRALRLALALRTPSNRGSHILVTSAEPGAGKSTIAANLALVSAIAGGRVLLIDADLAKPSQHEIFAVERRPGLVDFLASGGEVDGFVRSGPSSLKIMTAGREVSRATEILSSPRMADLFNAAAERFDVIIVDTASVLSTADAAAIATRSALDVLFVVARTTRRHDVSRALRRLELVHAPIAGLVLNREGQQEAYGFGD